MRSGYTEMGCASFTSLKSNKAEAFHRTAEASEACPFASH